jgi:hypothetical protein
MAESGGTEDSRTVSEDEITVSDDEVRQLDARGAEAAIINGQLVGSNLRINWGPRMGKNVLTVNFTGVNINANSQVFVSAHEGNFIGDARYTVHNIAPFNNGVRVWFEIEWGAPITLIADYLIL